MKGNRGSTTKRSRLWPTRSSTAPALNLTIAEAFGRHRRVFAVLLALTAGALTLVSGFEESSPESPVVVAARELPLGTELSAQDLKVVRLPEPAAQQLGGLWPDTSELIGRRLLVPLSADTPLTRSAILGSELLESIPPGTQAVTLHPHDDLSTRLIPPGSTVEVIQGESFEDGRTEPTVLTSEALVLYNAQFQRHQQASGWPSLASDKDEGGAIVVAVPHDHARSVVSAAARGNILLTLSTNTADSSTTSENESD